MNNVRLDWNDFTSGRTRECFCVGTTAPGKFDDFAAEAAALWREYEAAGVGRGLDRESEVLLRFHLSDPANQAPFLRELLDGRPASTVGQPPADGSRIALEAWHRRGENDLKMFYSPTETTGDSCAQTRRLFSALDDAVRDSGGEVARNVLRTWLYCRDVDNNYAGLVRGRNEYFDSIGLAERFIASTGIDGCAAEPSQLVVLDALTATRLSDGAVTHLRALDRLSPTALYGVRFERGSRVDLGDRALHLISGTASIDRHGKVLHPGDVRGQSRRMLENISALLAEGGASLGDVRLAVVYLRDAADLPVVKDLFAGLPTVPLFLRAPVCRPAWLIECECIAVTAN